MTYRGFRHINGRVVEADTGAGLGDARVIACLVDRHPSASRRDCASTPWKEVVFTDSQGGFEIEGSWHVAVALPFPGGVPTYDTDLLVQKDGYAQKELTWWRDGESLSRNPLIIRLEPTRVAPRGAPTR